jgi:hypothetical protein
MLQQSVVDDIGLQIISCLPETVEQVTRILLLQLEYLQMLQK